MAFIFCDNKNEVFSRLHIRMYELEVKSACIAKSLSAVYQPLRISRLLITHLHYYCIF